MKYIFFVLIFSKVILGYPVPKPSCLSQILKVLDESKPNSRVNLSKIDIRYYYSEDFDDKKKQKSFEDEPLPELVVNRVLASRDLYSYQYFDSQTQFSLFKRMNYFKYRMKNSTSRENIKKYLNRYLEIREILINSNLRLTIKPIKYHLKRAPNQSDLIESSAIYGLVRGVDLFDYTRSIKATTYLGNAIFKNIRHSLISAHKKRLTLASDLNIANDSGSKINFISSIEDPRESHVEVIEACEFYDMMRDSLRFLSPRERKILELRFFGDEDNEPMTLEQVRACFGLSKERVRQIQNKALEKLRIHFDIE